MKYAPYTIMQRRHFYGERPRWESMQWEGSDYSRPQDGVLRFAERSLALCWIKQRKTERESLYHNEYSAPDYGYVQPSGRIRRIG